MIPFDLEYLRPESLEEALAAWSEKPVTSLYYAGGTDIVPGCRKGEYRPERLIDLKALPELRAMGEGGAGLYFGAALSLTELAGQTLFPLLAGAARGVADRTVRNRLTLGGNVVGRLPWREALLPFLAADGLAHLAYRDEEGILRRRELPLRKLQEKRLRLAAGEILLGMSVTKEAAAAPSHRERIEGGSRVDYPLVALCALYRSGSMAVAVSGSFDYPVWMEGGAEELRVESFPRLRSDTRGSAEYRAALLADALSRAAAKAKETI